MTIQLEIVTPERLVVDTTADDVLIPGKSGYLGVLPGHAPLLTELMIGEISYTHGATTQYLAVSASLQWGPWGPEGYFKALGGVKPERLTDDATIAIYRWPPAR